MFRYKFENALIRLFDTGRLEYDFHDLMEFMVYGLHQKGGEEKGLNSAFGTALDYKNSPDRRNPVQKELTLHYREFFPGCCDTFPCAISAS